MKRQNTKNEGVFTVNGKKAMFALFEDEDYEALKSGEAVDNNGFRSTKGNYRSRQPQYADITPEAAVEIASTASSLHFTSPHSETIGTPTTAWRTVPAVCREPSEQLGKQVKMFFIKNLAAPVGSYVFNQCLLPWIMDKVGDYFWQITGYRKPAPVPFYTQVIDAEEVRQSDESGPEKTSYESDKIVKFPA